MALTKRFRQKIPEQTLLVRVIDRIQKRENVMHLLNFLEHNEK